MILDFHITKCKDPPVGGMHKVIGDIVKTTDALVFPATTKVKKKR